MFPCLNLSAQVMTVCKNKQSKERTILGMMRLAFSVLNFRRHYLKKRTFSSCNLGTRFLINNMMADSLPCVMVHCKWCRQMQPYTCSCNKWSEQHH